MATIYAPNKNYTGLVGNIEFAGGVAPFVKFESDEKEEMVLDILEGKGFTIISDEEYAEKHLGKKLAEVDASINVELPDKDGDELPPIDDEDGDEDDGEGEGLEGNDGAVVSKSNKKATGRNTIRPNRNNKGKANK